MAAVELADGRRPPDPSQPWQRHEGHLPVVLHVPHAGTWIPEDERPSFVLDDEALSHELVRMTDHHTDLLAVPAIEAGAYAVVNRLSRLVCDPERFPDERETMEQVGMGFAYARTADGQVLREVTAADRERIRRRWYDPYATAVADLVREVHDRFGRCLVLDVHSYPSRRLPYETGRIARPDVCLGTDEFHTPGSLTQAAIEACDRRGLWWDYNTPFTGAYVPAWARGSVRTVSALMVEVRRDVYLDEGSLELREDGVYVVGELIREVAAGLEVGAIELPDGFVGWFGGTGADEEE